MQFLTIILLAVLLTACGKNVDTKNPTPKLPPIANPGIVVGNPLPGYFGTHSVEFSNHNSGDSRDTTSNYSQYVFADTMTIQLNPILEVGFNTGSYDYFYRGTITIVINNNRECDYTQYSANTMILESGCLDDIEIYSGDVMWIEGVSPHWNIDLGFDYQK